MADGLGPGHLAFNFKINNELQVDGARHCMNAHIRSIFFSFYFSVHKCFREFVWDSRAALWWQQADSGQHWNKNTHSDICQNSRL